MTPIRRHQTTHLQRSSKRDGAQEIRAYLLDAVAQGAVGPGGKLPTERELATRFALPR
ncbi:MAG: GntR family transcriptional regulator, partial [Burkholderiales bacterium]